MSGTLGNGVLVALIVYVNVVCGDWSHVVMF